MHNLLMIYITINTMEQAQVLAHLLLENRLVACVNIIPAVQSMYIWEGVIAQDNEVIMIAKTIASKYDALQEVILSKHPYQVPCIVKFEVEAHSTFMDFVHRAVA